MDLTTVDTRLFQISIDANQLRSMYNNFGAATLDSALEKIATDLKYKIRSALKLNELTGGVKPLVEAVK